MTHCSIPCICFQWYLSKTAISFVQCASLTPHHEPAYKYRGKPLTNLYIRICGKNIFIHVNAILSHYVLLYIASPSSII